MRATDDTICGSSSENSWWCSFTTQSRLLKGLPRSKVLLLSDMLDATAVIGRVCNMSATFNLWVQIQEYRSK